MSNRAFIFSALVVLFGANIFLALQALQGVSTHSEIAFIDVGEGSSELLTLREGGHAMRMLIDGGPGGKVIGGLSALLPAGRKPIDLVVLTHAHEDHFEGLIDVAKRYRVGLFLSSGVEGEGASWEELARTLREKRIPSFALHKGDRVRYGGNVFSVLSPNELRRESGNPNDATLVLKLETPEAKALFAGDMDARLGDALAEEFDLKADILQVPHHGSKGSLSQKFFDEVAPKVAVIGVGKNTYGHPAGAVLEKLKTLQSAMFRTDTEGTVRIELKEGVLNILKEK